MEIVNKGTLFLRLMYLKTKYLLRKASFKRSYSKYVVGIEFECFDVVHDLQSQSVAL